MSVSIGECPLSGVCKFAGICEDGDTSLVFDAIVRSPEMQVLAPELGQDEVGKLVRPVLEAWDSDRCLREKIRTMKELQFQAGISHVSMSMGSSVLSRVTELLDES